jgi:gamma-glutamylcyclotransferase (GGCT)/AIG2-like uncharacterized protein YtfP
MAKPAHHAQPAASEPPPGTGEHLPGSGLAPARGGHFVFVFVYGTLKRGEKNHHWLEGASFQGEAELNGVVLHDLGPFPMAVVGEGTAIGEVYAVEGSGLARLDQLEGYPRLYDRQVLSLCDGRRAWVYLGRPRQVRHAPVVTGGLWRASSGPFSRRA